MKHRCLKEIMGGLARAGSSWLIVPIIVLSLFVNLYGIDHSTPDEKKTTLLFADASEIQQISEKLVQDRELTLVKGEQLIQEGIIYSKEESDDLYWSDRSQTERIYEFLRRHMTVSYQPDEAKAFSALSRMNPSELDFNPQYFYYGGGYLYSLAAWLRVWSVLGGVNLVPDLQHYFYHPEQMKQLYAVGRSLGALFASLSAFVVFLIGRRLFRKKDVAIISALLSMVMPLVTVHSHWVKPHCFAMFWALLSFYFCTRILESDKVIWYVAAGASAGLSAASMYPMGLVIFSTPISHYLKRISGYKEASQSLRVLLERKVYLSVAAFVAVFVIVNPYLFVSISTVLYEVRVYPVRWKTGLSLARHWGFLRAIPRGMGLPLSLAGLFGTCYSMYRRSKGDILILTSFVPPLLAIPVIGGTSPRHALPALALLTLLVSRMLLDLSETNRILKCIIVLVIVFVFGYGLVYSLYYDEVLIAGDQYRIQAGAWINANIEPGESIGLYRIGFYHGFPPFRINYYRIIEVENDISILKDELPKYYVFHRQGRRDADFIEGEDFISLYRPVKRFASPTTILGFRFTNELVARNTEVIVFERRSG